MLTISRRTFIAASSATMLLAAVGQSIAAAAQNLHRRILVGSLKSIGDPHTVTLASGDELRTVKFLGDGSAEARATFNRDGEAALAEFHPGDQVVVELRESGRPERGTRMELLYRWYYGYVTGQHGFYIYTNAGRIRMDSRTEIHIVDDFFTKVPLSALTPGTKVHVTVRWEPTLGEYLARSIGVEPD